MTPTLETRIVTISDLIIVCLMQLVVLFGAVYYLKHDNTDRKTAAARDVKARRLCEKHGGLKYVYTVALVQDSEKVQCLDSSRFRIATGEEIR